jgi:hypothetical protein
MYEDVVGFKKMPKTLPLQYSYITGTQYNTQMTVIDMVPSDQSLTTLPGTTITILPLTQVIYHYFKILKRSNMSGHTHFSKLTTNHSFQQLSSNLQSPHSSGYKSNQQPNKAGNNNNNPVSLFANNKQQEVRMRGSGRSGHSSDRNSGEKDGNGEGRANGQKVAASCENGEGEEKGAEELDDVFVQEFKVHCFVRERQVLYHFVRFFFTKPKKNKSKKGKKSKTS